ncbi:MAG: cytochrome c [Gammaproteobacteria bacterium]|nr:cytochrome c [Gammaproteobacteria bacterium]
MHAGSVQRWASLFALAAPLLFTTPAEADPAGAPAREQQFFEEKCGNCHPQERIFLLELTPEQRRHVVLRMRERLEAGSRWLSDEEVERILAYVETRSGDPAVVQPERSDDGKQLFRERCKGCHELDRVYRQVQAERDNPYAWMHVVTRMQAKNADWISEDEAQRIVEYLRSRTVPKPRD